MAKFKSKKKLDTGTVVYEYGPRQISERNKGKAERIESLRKSIGQLRSEYKKDLASKDEKTRMVALAVALMDETFERVGNAQSAKDGHFGVTGWRKKHVTFTKGKAKITYVGKSGVKHEKEVTTPATLKVLKEFCEGKGPSDEILDGVEASNVNTYLTEFDITAKDLRGYHANTEVQTRLKKIRAAGPKLPKGRKEKDKILKKEFAQAVEEAAEAVGHEPSTLRSQYLAEGMEEHYLHDGTVIKNLTDRKASYDVLRHCPHCMCILHDGPRYHEHCDDCGYDVNWPKGLERKRGAEWASIPENDPRLVVWRAQQKTQTEQFERLFGPILSRKATDINTRIIDWLDSLGDPMTLYRAIYVNSIDDVHTDKLGVFWSATKEAAHSPYGKLDKSGRFEVIVVAEVPRYAVDEAGTIATMRRYPDEKEVRLEARQTVKVKGFFVGGDFISMIHMGKVATKSESEKMDEEAERLIKPEPKLKPPRKDLRRRKVDTEKKEEDPDMSLNYKKVAAHIKGFKQFLQEEGDRTVSHPIPGQPKIKIKSLSAIKDKKGQPLLKKLFEDWKRAKQKKEQSKPSPQPKSKPQTQAPITPPPGEEDKAKQDKVKEDAAKADKAKEKQDKADAKAKAKADKEKAKADKAKVKPKKEDWDEDGWEESPKEPYTLNGKSLSNDVEPLPSQGFEDRRNELHKKRFSEAFEFYSSDEDGIAKRESHAQKLLKDRKGLPEESPKAIEIEAVLDGMALAGALQNEDTPGRPRLGKEYCKLVQILDDSDQLHLMSGTMKEFTSPESKKAISAAYKALDDDSFIESMGGEDGSMKLLIEAFKDEKTLPDVKDMLKEYMADSMMDRISLLDPLLEEHLGNSSPEKMNAFKEKMLEHPEVKQAQVKASQLLKQPPQEKTQRTHILDKARRIICNAWTKYLDKYANPSKPGLARLTVDKAVSEGMTTAMVQTDPPLMLPKSASSDDFSIFFL